MYKKAVDAAPTAKLRTCLGGKDGGCTFPKFSQVLEYEREWRDIGPTKLLDASAFEASNGAGKAGLKSGLAMSNRSLVDVGRQLLCTSARLQAIDDLAAGPGAQPGRGGVAGIGHKVGRQHRVLEIRSSQIPWVVLLPGWYFYNKKIEFTANSRPRGEWGQLLDAQPELAYLGAPPSGTN